MEKKLGEEEEKGIFTIPFEFSSFFVVVEYLSLNLLSEEKGKSCKNNIYI
jgi:hypothetical protein